MMLTDAFDRLQTCEPYSSPRIEVIVRSHPDHGPDEPAHTAVLQIDDQTVATCEHRIVCRHGTTDEYVVRVLFHATDYTEIEGV